MTSSDWFGLFNSCHLTLSARREPASLLHLLLHLLSALSLPDHLVVRIHSSSEPECFIPRVLILTARL